MMSRAQEKAPITIKRLIPLGIVAIVAVVGFMNRDLFSFQTLSDHREALIAWRDGSYLMALIGFMLAYFLIVAFSLPGALVMTLTGGFLFGIFPGAILVIAAATTGAVAIFLAAKTGLGDGLHAKLKSASSGSMLARLEKGLHENEVSYLLLMRLVPAIPFFVANLAPAFLGVKLRNFALTTFFGIMPGSLVYTWVGSGLGEVFARGETPDLGIFFEWHILGPVLGLCALSALPIVLKAFRNKGNV